MLMKLLMGAAMLISLERSPGAHLGPFPCPGPPGPPTKGPPKTDRGPSQSPHECCSHFPPQDPPKTARDPSISPRLLLPFPPPRTPSKGPPKTARDPSQPLHGCCSHFQPPHSLRTPQISQDPSSAPKASEGIPTATAGSGVVPETGGSKNSPKRHPQDPKDPTEAPL